MRLTILLLAAVPLYAQPVCRTPLGAPCYSIVTKREQTVLFRDGITDLGTYTAIETRAQASDGSFAVITDYSSTTLQGMYNRKEREFYDASANLRYWLSPAKKTWVRNQPHIAPRPLRPPRMNAECQPLPMSKGEAYQKINMEKILGWDTVHWRTELPRGGSLDVWNAPALDCTTFRSKRVEKGSVGIPVLIDTTQATKVEAGEPHRSLFTVPAGYREDDDPRHFRYGTRR